MADKKKTEEIMRDAVNGIITTDRVTRAGIHRGVLGELVKAGKLEQYARGLYVRSDAWEDDMYLLQLKYSRGIYSYNTALYLLGYSDRAPFRYTMTFPQGYNAPSLKNENLEIKRVIKKFYLMGITEIGSPSGNSIRIYDLERTLCDIVRGPGIDIQIVNNAMKLYAYDRNRDLSKLFDYAEKLHVLPKIRNYMEVLL